MDCAEHAPGVFRDPLERTLIEPKLAERENLFCLAFFQIRADVLFLFVIIFTEHVNGLVQLFPVAAVTEVFILVGTFCAIKGGLSGGLSQSVPDAPEEFFVRSFSSTAMTSESSRAFRWTTSERVSSPSSRSSERSSNLFSPVTSSACSGDMPTPEKSTTR